jgi:hypothetical protein
MARRMRIRILQSVPLLAKLSERKLLKLAGVMKVSSCEYVIFFVVIYAYVYVQYMYIYMYIYIYTYMCIYMYTHISI